MTQPLQPSVSAAYQLALAPKGDIEIEPETRRSPLWGGAAGLDPIYSIEPNSKQAAVLAIV
jgi:hypothetical protein